MSLKNKSWLVMLVVFMSLFFARNLMLPMASDDIPYAFVWDGEDRGNLLDSVGHVNESHHLAISSARNIPTT